MLACGLAASFASRADDDPSLNTKSQKQAPTAFAADKPQPVLHWGNEDKSFVIPAFEILGFEYGLNRFDHYAEDSQTYGSPTSDFSHNIRHGWTVDNDKFSTNQFLHPYVGTIYQGFARSAGLDFWQSMAYSMGGSLLWEEAGEHTFPSINDQVATGIGGSFVGEPLFRMASLLLETGNDDPGFWRELGATLISPSTGFNRMAFGNRFRGVFPSHDPPVFTRIYLGVSLSTHFASNVNVNSDPSAPPVGQSLDRREASANFDIAYGAPGKPGYTYERPYDYFNFEFTASTSNTFENVFSRGLLYGAPYEAGPNYRGIWGLYGSYDYIAPQVFRVASTALSVGTTGQWWASRTIAVQGTGLAGLGYAGGGVIHGSGITSPGPEGDGLRDYHYGFTPQALIALRLIVGDRLSFDTTAREYYISRLGATESSGSEDIIRVDAALTLRVYNLHGITLRFIESRRDGRYPDFPASKQNVGTVILGYTLLGHTRFGAVDWRPIAEGGP